MDIQILIEKQQQIITKLAKQNPNDPLIKQLLTTNNQITSILQQKFESIDSELKQINNRLDQLADNNKSNQSSQSADEKERLRSLVVYGVAETTTTIDDDGDEKERAATATEQASADKEAINDIIDALGVPVLPIAVYRMGRTENRKSPRPLKVVLPAKQLQWQCLGAWKHQRNSMQKEQHWRSLVIRPSLPPEVLRQEWEKRRAQGNEDGKNISHRKKNFGNGH